MQGWSELVQRVFALRGRQCQGCRSQMHLLVYQYRGASEENKGPEHFLVLCKPCREVRRKSDLEASTGRMIMSDKPESRKALFLPLRTEYFEAFCNGSKREELRQYGPRWNETTCTVGRTIILSKGYGKQSRMKGRIWRFKKQRGNLFGSTYKRDIEKVFGTLDIEIACISITELEPVT